MEVKWAYLLFTTTIRDHYCGQVGIIRKEEAYQLLAYFTLFWSAYHHSLHSWTSLVYIIAQTFLRLSIDLFYCLHCYKDQKAGRHILNFLYCTTTRTIYTNHLLHAEPYFFLLCRLLTWYSISINAIREKSTSLHSAVSAVNLFLVTQFFPWIG